MARFTELSNTRGSQWGTIALSKMIEDSPLLRFLEAYSAFQLAATEDSFRPVNATGTIGTREEGDNYTPAQLALDAKQNTQLYFHGNSIAIDETRLADAEKNLLDIKMYLEDRIPEEVYNFTVNYEKLLFLGDGADGEIKGIKTILNGTDDIPGFKDETGVLNGKSYSTATTPVNLDLTDSARYADFVKMLRRVIAEVPNANGIWVNPAMWAVMCAVADSSHALSESRDRFGLTIKQFDGVQIVPMLGTSILNTEPDDTATPLTNTTSIYIVHAAENFLSVLTNSGLDWKDIDLSSSGNKSQALEWEVRSAIRIKKPDCVRRIRNIKI